MKRVKQKEMMAGESPTPLGITDQEPEFVTETREDRRKKVKRAGKGKN